MQADTTTADRSRTVLDDIIASQERHSQQISSLTRDISETNRNVREMSAGITSLREALGKQISEVSKPNYNAMGVAVTVIVALCSAAWYTIGITTTWHERQIDSLSSMESKSRDEHKDFERRMTRAEVLLEVFSKQGPEECHTKRLSLQRAISNLFSE